MAKFERVIWIVLDSVGIGELPDAADYDDVGRNTLGHIAKSRPLALPNLVRLGLANIAPLNHLAPAANPRALRQGRDAFAGERHDHRALGDGGDLAGAGVSRVQAGISPGNYRAFEKAIGRKTIGNKPASGTEIIKELGEEHVRTGLPIVYTSGDSVFQIAAHEDVIPIAELYRMCEIARKMLDGPHQVGRVIARPFTGAAGNFRRTERRHDYAVEPPRPMLMDVLVERKVPIFGIGKIHDIYNGRGVDRYVTTKTNTDGMQKLTAALREQKCGLIFCNLVDFDMLYGHRKDVEGFAKSLEEFDLLLAPVFEAAGAARFADDHRRSWLRSGSGLADDGSFAGVCADRDVHGRQARGESRRARRWRTWGRRLPRISAGGFRTGRAFWR